MLNPASFTPEPDNCPECGARRQLNVDNEVIHARAGTIECPAEPFSEGPVEALLGIVKELTALNTPRRTIFTESGTV